MSVHHPIVRAGTQGLNAVSGALWLAVSRLHCYWRARRRPATAPVILVVGSLRAGGTGKTDLVAWIAARHPAVAILVHPTIDEETWLARQFPQRVFAHRDWLVAWEAARRAGFGVAVSDGGLQDPALDDCPALCVDLDETPRLADLLPCGRYRELSPRPRKSLLRLSLQRDLSPALDTADFPSAGTRVVAACSVARPEAFFRELEKAGLEVVERLAFGDHRRFDRREVREAIARHPDTPWVVTAKDAARGELARLPEGSFAMGRILSPSESATNSVDALMEALRSSLRPSRGSAPTGG